ncbi:hypothetical protein EAH81_04520 [Flavobacterium pectinovorum]|uniref:YD repeat-containing protein n=2 Tax=Flavobacterium pectinovorum TaxID=29533 RepID=A0A502F5I2_9FLAO|nr:hypothetical protein EAH81_04520 [Flavobacterium pectinovorum]
MFHNTNAFATSSDELVNMQYDKDQRVVKKTGKVLWNGSDSSIPGRFSNEIFEDVSYSNGQIKIVLKTTYKEFQLYAYDRTIVLDSKNRMAERWIYSAGDYIKNDTIRYFYNDLDQIIATKKGNSTTQNESAQYYYNPAGNLDSIVTKMYTRTNYDYRNVEVFSDYDNAPNPLKKLVIFEDTYLRALSKNNFTKYQKQGKNIDNSVFSNTKKIWKLNYDARGNVKFDVYF